MAVKIIFSMEEIYGPHVMFYDQRECVRVRGMRASQVCKALTKAVTEAS